MYTSETLVEAFVAREDEMRARIAAWLSENGWALRDLQTDSAMSRRSAADKHADSLMMELRSVRLEHGSSV